MHHLHYSITIAILLVCITLTYCTDANISYSANHTFAYPYLGFGATIWPGDMNIEPVLQRLNMKIVRLWIDYDHALPADASPQQFDQLWDNYNLYNVKRSASLCDKYGATILMVIKRPPSAWLQQPGNKVPSKYFLAYARYWGAGVAFMRRNGINVQYVELFNEEDGAWDSHVEPFEYSTISSLTRNEFNRRSMYQVNIVGPGTSHINWNGGDPYVAAANVSAISAWSNHAYEWDDAVDKPDGQTWMRPHSRAMVNQMNSRKHMPIFVTEFATKARIFHGKKWEDYVKPNGLHLFSDVDPYAIRVASNLLELTSSGVSACFYWEAADQSWEADKFGLITSDGRKKCIFDAIEALLGMIPYGAQILQPQNLNTDVSSAVFIKSNVVYASFVNGAGDDRQVNAYLAALKFASNTPDEVQVWSRTGNSDAIKKSIWLDPNVGWIAVKLPSDTIITMKMRLQ
jgi:hypothetical protein